MMKIEPLKRCYSRSAEVTKKIEVVVKLLSWSTCLKDSSKEIETEGLPA